MHPIFVQTFYYGIVVLLAALAMSFIQRGFFWKFIKVKMSFGRLVLVKLRAVNRDYYAVGKIEESFLVFTDSKKDEKRINIKDRSVFYKSLGVLWVDVDEGKNALAKTNYSAVTGFDAVKYNELYIRALYKPNILDKQEKLMLLLLIIAAAAGVLSFYLVYKQGAEITLIHQAIEGIKSTTAQAIERIPI